MPTTSITDLPANISTDAQYRTLVQKIGEALAPAAGGGLIRAYQSADPTTALIPATGAFGITEVYRFDDTLQTASPVFFKIRYGRSGTNNRPFFEVSTGRGHDGAGNLTTDASITVQVGNNNALGSAAANATGGLEASVGPDRFALLFFPELGNGGWGGIFLGRLRDANGVQQADRLIFSGFYTSNSSSMTNNWCRIFRSAVGWVSSYMLPLPAIENWPNMRNTGGDLALAVPSQPIGSEMYYWSDLVAYGSTDIAQGTIFNAVVLGSLRPYKAQGPRFSGLWSGSNVGTSPASLAMRWE